MSPPMTTSPPRTAPEDISLLIECGTTPAVIGNSTGAVLTMRTTLPEHAEEGPVAAVYSSMTCLLLLGPWRSSIRAEWPSVRLEQHLDAVHRRVEGVRVEGPTLDGRGRPKAVARGAVDAVGDHVGGDGELDLADIADGHRAQHLLTFLTFVMPAANREALQWGKAAHARGRDVAAPAVRAAEAGEALAHAPSTLQAVRGDAPGAGRPQRRSRQARPAARRLRAGRRARQALLRCQRGHVLRAAGLAVRRRGSERSGVRTNDGTGD
eukprot:scaffold36678_cov49-Phaeocystis_antarctica.AAC.1